MSLNTSSLYTFDQFELQPSRRALIRQGERVAISPKSFEVLLYLVQNAGKVVLKEELLKAVWPDSFVEESNLTQHIFWLRKALGDRSGFIATVPGRGYEFLAEVQAVTPSVETIPPPQSVEAEVTQAGFQLHRSIETTRIVIEETTVAAPQTVPQTHAIWKWAVGLGVAAIIITSAALGYWRYKHHIVPGDHHEVVLADFENSTGDPEFDRALRTLLVFDLNQSSFLVAATDTQTRATLKQMKRPADADLTPAVAREVCERLNDQAVLAGLITRVGQKYLVTLTASDCATGKDLVQAKSVADSHDTVLASVEAVASQMRERLGEPLRKLQPGEYLPPEHTYSLEALKLYSQARTFHYKQQFKEAAALYQRAIDIDPNFATAYAQLANCYNNLGEQTLGERAMEKAYTLRDQTDGPDKLRIKTMYEYWKTGNRHVAIENYKLWTSMYPRSAYPWILLGEFEDSVGERGPAIEAEKTAIALDPLQLSAYTSLATYEFSEGRFDDLKETTRKAQEHGYDPPDFHKFLLNAAWVQNDANGMQQQRAWLETKGSEDDRQEAYADIDLAEGKIQAGLDIMLHQADQDKKEDRVQAGQEKLSAVVATESDLGLTAKAQQHLKLLRPMPAVNAEAFTNIIMALAQTGSLAEADKILQHMIATNKQDSDVAEFFAPEAEAIIALARNKPADAITALEPAVPYAHVYPSVSDFRGRAYLALKQPELAIHEFRLITDHPSSYLGPDLALCHLNLARALKMSGDLATARREYQAFFNLWKDADPDLPAVKQAKVEMAALPMSHIGLTQ